MCALFRWILICGRQSSELTQQVSAVMAENFAADTLVNQNLCLVVCLQRKSVREALSYGPGLLFAERKYVIIARI